MEKVFNTEGRSVNGNGPTCLDLERACRCIKGTERDRGTAVSALELHVIADIRRPSSAELSCTACPKGIAMCQEPSPVPSIPSASIDTVLNNHGGQILAPLNPRPVRPVRDRCCLRYRRKGTKCSVCPLRPENGGADLEPTIVSMDQ